MSREHLDGLIAALKCQAFLEEKEAHPTLHLELHLRICWQQRGLNSFAPAEALKKVLVWIEGELNR